MNRKYEVKGVMFHKRTDDRITFCEYTVAISSKKALSNIRFRLKDYHLRDIEINPLEVIQEKPKQLNLFNCD